jgi:pimeloyl-ACP methyl ester carboxylesterase
MNPRSIGGRLLHLLLVAPLLAGCSVLQQFEDRVAVRPVQPGEYIARKRGDILTSGRPGQATLETIRVAALDGACPRPDKPSLECIAALARAAAIEDERRLSALSELWVQQALSLPTGTQDGAAEPRLGAWLEAARHAYAYLFFTGRKPGQRAFEDRQTQVRDYYNLAVQEAAVILFARQHGRAPADGGGALIRAGTWAIRTDLSRVRMEPGLERPQELVPASARAFSGLRSQYRRDGFGAELVAVIDADADASLRGPAARAGAPGRPGPQRSAAWSAMPYRALTALAHFQGRTIAEVLSTHALTITAYDPYEHDQITLNDEQVPLAGHFTAGYGLWLARSGFARQSIQALLGRKLGIDRPHLYLMQPYDPGRRVIVMIHGLASSPDAWVNMANEIMGDETLRRHYQVWQVYYPTNLPVALSHFQIRRAVHDALRHFDPGSAAPASRDMVLIGHSMGGLIARLMVSSAKDGSLSRLIEEGTFDSGQKQRLQARLAPLIDFAPMPEARRAVFLAAPHRGTPIARRRLGLLLADIIRLPLTVLEGLADLIPGDAAGSAAAGTKRLPNSLDNLRDDDRFVRAAAELPISPQVRYHSIIARATADGALADTDDGLVPYRSAHLPGAISEKVIVSGHSVQETAAAILELRRILHADLAEQPKRDQFHAAPAP